MGKAKTASKNNPTTRQKAKEDFYQGKKIKPTMFYAGSNSFLAAEFDENNTIVKGPDGRVLSWARATKG